MSTPFAPLEIPPGVVSTGTKQMRSSNWSEVNFIRWREGQLAPMGGQAQYTSLDESGDETYLFASKCKKIHGWYGLDSIYRIAYLCESNLYVDVGGSLTEITPLDGIAPPSGLTGGFGDGLFSAGTFSTPRPISAANAALRVPDAYSLDNFGSILYAMTSSDGRLLRWDPAAGDPGVTSVVLAAAGAFTTSSPNITMSAANPGTVVPGMPVYDTTNSQNIGLVLSWVGTALILKANALHASAGASDVLRFTNVAAPQIAAAGRGPVPHARCFVVTQERFIMVFGSVQDGTTDGGSSRRMAWCDQENPGAWDYASVTSQAGFQDIEPASPIVCALASRVGIIFWTGKKVYASKFLGLPYVYNNTELADGTTPWSPQSISTTSALALWMSEQGLFSYDGTSVLPVACQIRSWIDDAIDIVNVREESFACHVASFNEWWWFFPENGVIITKGDAQWITNTRAMVYNYKEGWFTQVRCSRSAGDASSYTAPPIMADVSAAFQHEVGNVYANYSIPAQPPFAETFDLNLSSGAILTTVKQMIPNVEGDISNLRYSIFYRNSRSLGTAEQQSMLTPVRPDGYVDFRVTGRDIRLRIDVASSIVQPFTLGQHLFDVTARGDR